MRSFAVAALVLGVTIGAPVSARSQGAPLERVEELARLGRTEEARGVLLGWWDGARESSSRRDLQRGLWLRGRLTVDPVQAELEFQRLVVLYPNGPFTPQAIYRLAQSAYAQGNADGARSHVATLVRDYPNVPTRGEAEAWLRAAGPVPDTPDAPTSIAIATAEAPVDSGGAVSEPPQNFFVQLGAFSDEARALALFEEVAEQGLEVRLVRVEGSGFLHVRIGRFTTRIEASDRVEELAELGVSAAIVRDDRAEELVRS